MDLEGGSGYFLGLTTSLESSGLSFSVNWSGWRSLGVRKFVPGVCVGDDDMRRVLMGLR